MTSWEKLRDILLEKLRPMWDNKDGLDSNEWAEQFAHKIKKIFDEHQELISSVKLPPVIEDYEMKIKIIGFNRTGDTSHEEAAQSIASLVSRILSEEFGGHAVIVDYQ